MNTFLDLKSFLFVFFLPEQFCMFLLLKDCLILYNIYIRQHPTVQPQQTPGVFITTQPEGHLRVNLNIFIDDEFYTGFAAGEEGAGVRRSLSLSISRLRGRLELMFLFVLDQMADVLPAQIWVTSLSFRLDSD